MSSYLQHLSGADRQTMLLGLTLTQGLECQAALGSGRDSMRIFCSQRQFAPCWGRLFYFVCFRFGVLHRMETVEDYGEF